jgi:hypothetical protein
LSRARGLRRLGACLGALAVVLSLAAGAFAAEATEYLRSFSPDGTESSEFEKLSSVAYDQQTGTVYVLDSVAGALYKFNAKGQPLPWGGSAPNLSGNKLTDVEPFTGFNESQIAVDSTNHVVYVTEQHSISAFHADGEPAEFGAGPGAGTNAIPSGGEIVGVAVDANGAVYANEYAGTVNVFAASGEPVTSFAVTPQSGNLGVGPGGPVYVVNTSPPGNEGGVYKLIPSEFPVSATTTYTAAPKLVPTFGNFAYGVGVDPVSGDVYLVDTSFSETWIRKFDSSGNFVGEFAKSGELPGTAQGVAVVGGGTELQAYVGVPQTGKVAIFGEVINPGPPSIESTSATDVSADSATLHAAINPNAFATTYHFEYGLGDCSTTACARVPLGEVGIGKGHRAVAVSQGIFGLQPGAAYHYRVVAKNLEGVRPGPDRIFTTQLSGLGFELPDDRAWEMVSPPNKHGASLVVYPYGTIQAAEDGNGLAYLSAGSIEADPAGSRSPEPSAVLARRAGPDWRSTDLTPPHTRTAGPISGEYVRFGDDLSEAVIEPPDGTPLSPQASERTPYLRENTEPPTYTPLVTDKEGFANVPPGTAFGGDPIADGRGAVRVLEVTPDLSHVVLVSKVALTPGAVGGGLFEWAAGQLQPLSVLPPAEGGTMATQPVLGSNLGSVRHALSDDGSRVFWGTGAYSAGGNGLTALYMRDTEAGETVRLDVVPPDVTPSGEARPTFQGASADGTVVFFTDTQQLTDDASSSGADLYRCEIPLGDPSLGCDTLTDLTAPAAGPGESAEVQGVVPALSDDGTHVCFIARGVLDSAANSFGATAVAGEPNLYLWQEGRGTRFVATLSDADRADWGLSPTSGVGQDSVLSAAASPAGRYLSFVSERSLSGYDNRDEASGEPVEQVFRYDAVADRLDCASCNPTGARPSGHVSKAFDEPLVDPTELWQDRPVAALLPPARVRESSWATLYRPRTTFDSGRVFFNAVDSLVAADSNGEWDVYQYEPTGVGDCTASSGGASLSRSAGGCVSLISSGTAEAEAAFLDASASGDDAFFLSPARLSVTDEDNELDLYDARVDGVPATLAPVVECLGEACQQASAAPNDPTPASSSFKGQGNLKNPGRKRCAKGRHKVRSNRRTRCVARKPHKRGHKRQASRAGHGGRASR